jgi:imidazolonepropionase-like amidohydrolase
MLFMKRLVFVVILTFFWFSGDAQKTYIQCGTLIDGISNSPRKNVTVVVEGKKIVEIKSGSVAGGTSDIVIDLSNKTVLPGLIDCHVHLEFQYSKNGHLEELQRSDAEVAFYAAGYARTTLMAGFTTVCDLGGSGVNIALRNAINKGQTEGPNILTAGKAISTTGGHMDRTVGFRSDMFCDAGPGQGVADGPDELMKAVRIQYKKGADLIKIASTGGVLDFNKSGTGAQMSIAEIRAVVETAKDYGMRVACHAHGAEGIRRAILGGVSSIEHGTYMDDQDIALMKKYGVYYVPTLTAGNGVTDSAKISGYFPKVIMDKAIGIAPTMKKTFAKAYKAGVKIAFGTDAGVYPHGKNYLEFKFMTEAGMTNMDAIKTATINAADLLGIKNERGSIEIGKIADIIAVDGNPLEEIMAMGKVTFVMKEGKVYKK